MDNDKGFIFRVPYVVIGAIGLLSLIDGLLTFHRWIDQWIDAWQATTRPIWEFAFGWIFAFFNMDIPPLFCDYLTVGVIVTGMFIRADNTPSTFRSNLALLVFIGPVWPGFFFSFSKQYLLLITGRAKAGYIASYRREVEFELDKLFSYWKDRDTQVPQSDLDEFNTLHPKDGWKERYEMDFNEAKRYWEPLLLAAFLIAISYSLLSLGV